MNKLTWDRDSFYLDGEPFRMIAGDIHYFRIHPADWGKRLDRALEFGLNTVQTYVPWNAHEPRPGEYNFSGFLDLGAYLRLCGEKGLKVLLRPSPYICSEWDFGGLPAWLLADREIVIRSSEPKYLAAVKRYYEHLIPQFLPYLATNGGPVIAAAVENEYGSYGNDPAYLEALAGMLREGGVDVPLYTTDGDTPAMLAFGRHRDDLFGVNYRAKAGSSDHAEKAARKASENNPFFIGEFWSGRSMHWGEPFSHRDPADPAQGFREALELGGHVCFYMFSGGTNFGFMGGGNIGRSYSPRPGTPARYIPHTTSYDVDALISEDGCPTEKFYLCRDVLDDCLGRARRERKIFEHPTQSFEVTVEETAELFDNLDALTEVCAQSAIPRPMEDYGQNYGLILYTTVLQSFADQGTTLCPEKFRDRATLYVNGEWYATHMRGRGFRAVNDGGILIPDGEKRIDMLVENLGRINYGSAMNDERKGAEDALCYGPKKLFGYTARTLPLKDLSGLNWKKESHRDGMPCFFRGAFDAQRDADTWLSFAGWGHGYAWLNGFNLGRYDSAGPQMTLYVPRHLLRESGNELIMLDLEPHGERKSVRFLDSAVLEGEAAELS